MATATAPSPGISPPPYASNNKQPPLPPLSTSRPTNRRTSQQRPLSSNLLSRRASSYSSTNRSIPPQSRPMSTVFPVYPSSLSYTLVRDFAYPWNHPMHYGPQPEELNPSSASERRVSDPEVGGWENARSSWSATPPWISDDTFSSSKDQLPARTYNDDGPPYSEDEDLQSPVVTTARHRKKSERGRSPGAAGSFRGVVLGANGEQIEHYRPTDDDELDGPGGEIETYPRPAHRDSNFARPIQREQSPYEQSYEDGSDDGDSDDDPRYSRDYSFSIASPDEEMHGKAVALFDFASEHENELALREGQIILVSYRHGQGWLVAEDPVTGESGLVPETYVRLVRHIEGGLNGLNSVGLDGSQTNSPVSNDNGSGSTPIEPSDAPEKQQPAVQSNFSTSTKDFSPLLRSTRIEQDTR